MGTKNIPTGHAIRIAVTDYNPKHQIYKYDPIQGIPVVRVVGRKIFTNRTSITLTICNSTIVEHSHC